MMPQRHADIIGLRPDKVDLYKRLHATVWPEILGIIYNCNIRNYSIYLRQLPDGAYCLFSYFEYVGTDFEGDMAKIAEDSKTKEWWALCKPCQQPLLNRAEGEWWSEMEEVFHSD